MPNESQPVFHPDFLIIPFQIAVDKKLHPLDKMIYAVIYWFEHLRYGHCTASNEVIGKIINLQNSVTVGNALSRLENEGYIRRVFKDKRKKVRLETQTLIAYKKVSSVDVSSVDVSPNDVSRYHQLMYRDSNERESNKRTLKSEILKKTEKKGNVKITPAQKEQLSYELKKIDDEKSLNNWILLCEKKGFDECLKVIIDVRDIEKLKNKGAYANSIAQSLSDIVP